MRIKDRVLTVSTAPTAIFVVNEMTKGRAVYLQQSSIRLVRVCET